MSEKSPTRPRLSLAGSWIRHLESPKGELFGDAVQVTLPGMWDEDPAGLEKASGFVHYERTFILPDWTKGARWVLRLEGVSRQAQVYLNGQSCMQHFGDRQAVEVAVNDLLCPGSNHIQIRLGNLLGSHVFPPGHSEKAPESLLGYHNDSWSEADPMGGIPGDILLYQTPWFYWQRLRVSWKEGKEGEVLCLDPHHVGPYECAQALIVDGENQYRTQAIAGAEETLELDVKELGFWSPQAPTIYELILESFSPSKLQDQWRLPMAIPSPDLNLSDYELIPAPRELYGPKGTDLLASLKLSKQVLDASILPILPKSLAAADRLGIPLVVGIPFRIESELFGSKEDLRARLAAWEQAAYSLIQDAALHACVAAWNFSTNLKEAKISQEHILYFLQSTDPFRRPVIL